MYPYPHTSFLNFLLTEKGIAPLEARIVQDNAKQLYRPKRKPLRIRSTSEFEGRTCRWSRTHSDLSLKAPSRPRSQQSLLRQGRKSLGQRGGSDISLFLASRSRAALPNNTYKPSLRTLVSPRARNQNAGWDQFDFVSSKTSGISALTKSDLLGLPLQGPSNPATPVKQREFKSDCSLVGKGPTSVMSPPVPDTPNDR